MRSSSVRWGGLFVAATLALAACGKSKSESRRDDDRDERSSKKEREPTKDEGRFKVDVSNATVDEALTAYRKSTGNDLGMKDAVRKQADCVRVTLSVERDSAQDVERALSDKLGEFGLKIEERAGLHGVVRDYSKPLPCRTAGKDDDPERLDPLSALSGLPRPTLDPAPEGIDKVDDNHYRIERTAFEALKVDGKGVRTMPHASGTKGISIYGIRYNSPLSALGFRNGDVLLRVNGVDLSDVSGALDAYNKLKNATTFIVELERRRSSTPVVLTIDVVPDGTVGKAIQKSPTALPP